MHSSCAEREIKRKLDFSTFVWVFLLQTNVEQEKRAREREECEKCKSSLWITEAEEKSVKKIVARLVRRLPSYHLITVERKVFLSFLLRTRRRRYAHKYLRAEQQTFSQFNKRFESNQKKCILLLKDSVASLNPERTLIFQSQTFHSSYLNVAVCLHRKTTLRRVSFLAKADVCAEQENSY